MKYFFFLILCLLNFCAKSQNLNDSISQPYNNAFNQVSQIIGTNGSFKEAVFIVESSFYKDSLDHKIFETSIHTFSQITNSYFKSQTLVNYRFLDTINFLKNYSIYKIIADTAKANIDSFQVIFLPFTYNFTDPQGHDDWSNMFVTKLLATHQGNCHSLAYLYKILADEIGAKCWLSLAPGHIFIKNYSDKIGWYNTELTSGTFPTDAWVMVTGYVNPEAIKSGLYMDTLSNQQSIALCVLDLAKQYEFQTHNYYDGFILKCCDLVLQYHAVNPMALLLKAETLKKVWLKETENKYPKPTSTPIEMENAYITLVKLGYREMPEKMYQQWLKEMTTEKQKYNNQKVTSTLQKN